MDFKRAVFEWDAFGMSKPSDSSRKAARREPVYDWLDSEGAQRIIDRVQVELDSELGNTLRHHRLGLLRYLSRRFQLLPLSLVLSDVERDGSNPVGGGGFAVSITIYYTTCIVPMNDCTYQDIWRGRLKGRPVCLKVLRFVVEQDESTRARMRKQFCHEALVWRQLNHPNILPLLGVNTELFFPSFCLVSPWMEHRDIITYLKKNPVYDLLSVLTDVVAGICYLHSRDPPVIHGDIRGGNILVTDDYRCCLADFGLTLVSTHSQTWSMTTSSATTKEMCMRLVAQSSRSSLRSHLSMSSRTMRPSCSV
ncbi:hypothetical protein GYMLUDRAFT_825126 [Collybiopsis luxurians FD-317 M1]|uniref:Protein kinase domain-containing protein n=1 Tax=Collybiopsis luxurians FD-317 M1 TaxID=944289 RepID=A0A0D0CDJ6_9AGAR|nr:hypothetical protein GYMLUDRAFT_825126 [Collybiopsis luxurians FD-317 M1]